MAALLPLDGLVVIDASRMLPGAVLVRSLIDLGARVIKIEDPGTGDLMRHAPPLIDGIGAGFRTFFAGCESITLDLRSPDGQAALRALCARADVFLESFRPGTLARWELDPARLRAANPRLITVSLSGFGGEGPLAGQVAHDLNLVAFSGLLSMLPGDGVPRVQLADVSTGMLATSAVLAALLQRGRTGEGRHLEQPLARGPLPFLAWAAADARAGGGGFSEGLLAGEAPAYRRYTCADGREITVGAIEPKFWQELVMALALPDLARAGLVRGPEAERVGEQIALAFARAPRAHWLALAAERNWPISAVNSLDEALAEPYYTEAAGFLPAWPTTRSEVPALGEATARVFAEFGVSLAP